MARRLPGIRQRMEDVALELYAKQGLAGTTARQIAAAAGTTERTFFRHFRDKVEVAFGDEQRLQQMAAQATRDADPAQGPLAAACAGLSEIAAEFDTRREAIIRRATIVASEPALRDREYGRSSAWVDALTEALCDRGEPLESAVLSSAVALTMFRVAFERWVSDAASSALSLHLQRIVDQLPVLVRDRS